MDNIPSEARGIKSLPHNARRMYVQPRLFASVGPFPTMATLTVAVVDGCWSVGATIIDLVSLEPLAITATPGQQPLEGRLEAHSFLSELLDVLQDLSDPGPFDDDDA